LDLRGVVVTLPPFSVLVDGPSQGTVGQEVALGARVGAGTDDGATYAWAVPVRAHLAPGASAANPGVTLVFDEPGDHLVGVTVTRGSHVVTGGTVVHVHAAVVAPALGTLTGGTAPTLADLDLLDAYLRGAGTLTQAQGKAADINLDGRVGRDDQALLLQAARAGAAAPVHVSKPGGAALTSVMVIHPALLDPSKEAHVQLTATTAGTWDAACLAGQQGKPHADEVASRRAKPGYLVFAVPVRYACLTTTETVRVELVVGGETHVLAEGFQVTPLPAASDHPGAPVIEAMGRLRVAMEALPAAAAAYADQVEATPDEKATMQGTSQRAAEMFRDTYREFFLAFQQLDAPTRAAWEQLARSQGLDAALEQLRDLTPSYTFDPALGVPSSMSVDTGEALVSLICAFNEIADVASKVAEINATVASALEWLDWWPLNKAPVAGPVISFLSAASNIVSAITDMIEAVAKYVPQFGETIQLRPAPGVLTVGQSCSVSAFLEIKIASGLCNQLAGAAVGSLVDAIKDALQRKLASMIPVANRAFKLAKYQRDDMGTVVGTVYDAVGYLAGKIVDATGLEGYLDSLADKVCGLLNDPAIPVQVDNLAASCGPVNQASWTCTDACAGYPAPRQVGLSGSKSVCGKAMAGGGAVGCLGEPPPECGNGIMEDGEQCENGTPCGDGLACNRACLCVEANRCGNNIKEAGEQCDGDNDCGPGQRCGNATCVCADIVCLTDSDCPDRNLGDCKLPFCNEQAQRCELENAGYNQACSTDPCMRNQTCDIDGTCRGGQNVCLCPPNTTEPCYAGDAATRGVGICKAGQHTCNARGTAWGPCEGEVTPGTETCETPWDEDCDGQVNEPDGTGCACTPSACSPGSAPYDCYEGFMEAYVTFGVESGCTADKCTPMMSDAIVFFYDAGPPPSVRVEVGLNAGTILGVWPCGSSCGVTQENGQSIAHVAVFGTPVTLSLVTASGAPFSMTATFSSEGSGSFTGAASCVPP
jgi:hypothetical protein